MWFSRSKMSQNQTLIGCLATAGQDWHLKIERSKPYFILQSLFEKKDSKPPPPPPRSPSPPRQIFVAGTF